MGDSRPIGVFDSGLGGVSVLRALCAHLPSEDFVYFGDSANAPYGVKTQDQILDLSRQATKRLLAFDVKAIVIACNTATAASAECLRTEYPHLPILGVEPAIRPAALSSKHPKVLIMATPMTLKMDKFKTLERSLSPLAEFYTLPCPGLVELIEQGPERSAQLREFLSRLLAPILASPPDAVVLGCTHYPFILPLLKELFPSTTAFFDGAEGTAKQLEKRLAEQNLLAPCTHRGCVRFLSSSTDPQTTALMESFFRSHPFSS
ncbi:MAG: glutamate racemase [Clostridia bacterium]|nr:glutamate racemase [Clostridia bacterium]